MGVEKKKTNASKKYRKDVTGSVWNSWPVGEKKRESNQGWWKSWKQWWLLQIEGAEEEAEAWKRHADIARLRQDDHAVNFQQLTKNVAARGFYLGVSHMETLAEVMRPIALVDNDMLKYFIERYLLITCRKLEFMQMSFGLFLVQS